MGDIQAGSERAGGGVRKRLAMPAFLRSTQEVYVELAAS